MLIENEHREYMVHSTLMFPEGSRVGMNVQPVDIHVAEKEAMSHEKNEDSCLSLFGVDGHLHCRSHSPCASVQLNRGGYMNPQSSGFPRRAMNVLEPIYLKVIVNSLYTGDSFRLTLLLGYPVAMIVARSNPKVRACF